MLRTSQRSVRLQAAGLGDGRGRVLRGGAQRRRGAGLPVPEPRGRARCRQAVALRRSRWLFLWKALWT